MGPKPNVRHHYMSQKSRRHSETQERGPGKTEAEVAAMQPQASNWQGPPEAEEARTGPRVLGSWVFS